MDKNVKIKHIYKNINRRTLFDLEDAVDFKFMTISIGNILFIINIYTTPKK